MEILWETLSFAAKGLTVFVVVALCAAVIFSLSRRGRRPRGSLRVTKLNDRVASLRDGLKAAVLTAKQFKRDKKVEDKAKKKQEERPRAFVLDFKGDMLASAVDGLREEITAVLGVAKDGEEVVIRLESPGGTVHGYGLAASQIKRLKGKDLKVTICVDKVAASGGYMMACIADEILAAPFAILGSIGVVSPVPNAHRLLERVGIDYDEMTAGEYKRTVSLFGKISDAGRAKYQTQLEEVHGLFKSFVSDNRPTLAIDEIATGEYWHGTRALELGLVDRLVTSDDHLLARMEDTDLYEVSYERPKGIKDRLADSVSHAVERAIVAAVSKLQMLSP